MFKKKCPKCGAKNDTARTTCIQCGTHFQLDKAGKQSTYISTENKLQAESVIEKEPIKPRYSVKRVTFWVGVGLTAFGASLVIRFFVISFAGPGNSWWENLRLVIPGFVLLWLGDYCRKWGRRH